MFAGTGAGHRWLQNACGNGQFEGVVRAQLSAPQDIKRCQAGAGVLAGNRAVAHLWTETGTMRLTDEQRRAIVAVTADLAGGDAQVRLFGSRAYDDLRGGDIDLLIECPHVIERPVRLATQLTARLQRLLGDRKIDVLVVDPQTSLEAVHLTARAEGVLL